MHGKYCQAQHLGLLACNKLKVQYLFKVIIKQKRQHSIINVLILPGCFSQVVVDVDLNKQKLFLCKMEDKQFPGFLFQALKKELYQVYSFCSGMNVKQRRKKSTTTACNPKYNVCPFEGEIKAGAKFGELGFQ